MIVYDIALTLIPEIGHIRGRRLIDTFGSAEAAFKMSLQDLIEQTQIPYNALKKMVSTGVFPAAEAELKFVERNGITAIPLTSDRYPRRLRECDDAPLVLYVKGDIDFNSDWWLSVVGTRKNTHYGREITDNLIDGIAERLPETVIVSGLALGTDISAHLAALRNGMKTVAVLGNNLGEIYPERHANHALKIIENGGALVSEFHSLCPVLPKNFLMRNRIIAGLSSGTVVVESAYKGGSLSTANYAQGYYRDVMAVPGRVGDRMSEGANKLIRDNKAAMVLNATDVLNALNWDAGSVKAPPREKVTAAQQQLFATLTDEEKSIFEQLSYSGTLSYDDLSVKTNMPSYRISSLLFNLEMSGMVRIKPGNMAEKV